MPSPSTERAPAKPAVAKARGGRHRGIKLAVIALGAIIIIGFVVVVTTIVQRLAKPAPGGEIGVIEVPVPAGCWIADAWSADGKLYLRLDGAADCRQLAIVDEATRKVTGRVIAVETTPAQ